MAKHQLGLNFPLIMEPCILRIEDISKYEPTLPVDCPTLQVLLPGFNTAALFNDTTTIQIQEGFIVNLNACDLEVQTDDCGSSPYTLPDGIYAIKYSVSPHDYVYVEYNHMRITNALIQWKSLLCELDLPTCDPGLNKKKRLAELMEIRGYLESAVAKVEICREATKGMDQYNYAISLMKKMNCQTC